MPVRVITRTRTQIIGKYPPVSEIQATDGRNNAQPLGAEHHLRYSCNVRDFRVSSVQCGCCVSSLQLIRSEKHKLMPQYTSVKLDF